MEDEEGREVEDEKGEGCGRRGEGGVRKYERGKYRK